MSNMTTPELRSASTTPTVSCPVVPHLKHLAFTCTFCWHISSTTPRVIGRSARLACEACYNALLGLSVCWACGEVVVRGDDCVSLDWCFWHKSCYGCLICGNRLVVRGVTVKEVFSDETDEEGTSGEAKEIDEIPLCAHCYVEVGLEEVGPRTVVNEALRRMDYRDGGLSRKRYEDGRQVQDDALQPERVSSLQDGGIGPAPLDATIYISIRDPTAPAFKPSPTKPLPQWIVGTQTRDIETNDHGLETEATPVADLRHPPAAELSLQRRQSSYIPSVDRTAKPHTSMPEPVRPTTPQDTMTGPVTTPILAPQPIPVVSPRTFRYSRAGYIYSESLKRPSSRLNRIREESSHVDSRTPSPYLTPPEWPDSMYGGTGGDESQNVTLQDDEVEESGQISIFSETSSQSLASLLSPIQAPKPSGLPRLFLASEPNYLPQHSRLPRKSTMLRAKIAAHHPPANPSAIPMSSEFLERYGLVKGREHSKPSALLKKTPPSSRRSSHEPQAIVARLTRNSRSAATTGLVDETTEVTETDRSVAPKQFSLDATTGSIALHDGPAQDAEHAGRRRSLQAELMRLFRGR